MLVSALFAAVALSAPPIPPPVGRSGADARAVAIDSRLAMWVFFQDRGDLTIRLEDAQLTDRALQRRARRGEFNDRSLHRGMVLSARDMPVEPAYVAAIQALGARVRVTSRWLNAVSVDVDRHHADVIAGLPFVDHVQPVRAAPRAPTAELPVDGGLAGGDYGAATAQTLQMDLAALHARGFSGQGVVVGILDTGFNRVHEAFASAAHPLNVLAEYDFINDDSNTGIEVGDPESQHRHGTWILGTMASYLPGQLVGAAYSASFVLAKTENVASETPVEEDYYVAGLEFVEAQGADLATSSLGYFDWYASEDLDGSTAVTTIAVNIATANGLVCLTAAGNGGHDDNPSTHHLGAPADALQVITCGAVDELGETADFSSDGPTADGRVKPEILARGVATATVNSTQPTGLSGVSGTSLSTPLVAGAVACVLQARTDYSVSGLREALIATATESASGPDPLFIRGFGLIQADAVARHGRSIADIDLDGEVDASDLAVLLGAWGSCGDCAACPFDLNGDCGVDAADLAILLGDWG
jgi:serine protease AprX